MLLLVNRLMEANFGYHVGYVSVKKNCPPFPRNQPKQTDVGYPSGYVSLIPCALVQNEALFCDPLPAPRSIHMVAEWIQFCHVATLDFITAPSEVTWETWQGRANR